jgi:ABC-type transport system substrate-binding protein
MDNLIDLARSTTVNATRSADYNEIQQMALQQCPLVPLYQGGVFAVTKSNIAGVYLDVTTNWRDWLLYRT